MKYELQRDEGDEYGELKNSWRTRKGPCATIGY